LLLAGDVSDHLDIVKATFEALVPKFYKVFFCPGNHDLWTSPPEHSDSLSKWKALKQLCRACGVCTSPQFVGGRVWIVPLQSWYCDMIEQGGGVRTDLTSLMGWSDFHNCVWPASVVTHSSSAQHAIASERAPAVAMKRSGSRNLLDEAASKFFSGKTAEETNAEVAEKLWLSSQVDNYFLRQNDELLERLLPRIRADIAADSGRAVITFSHFQPRLDLLPPQEKLVYKELGRVCCSGGLERQLRRLGADVHVFGHTHINCDQTLGGVRYIQHPLKYPEERLHWITLGSEWLGPSQLAEPVWESSASNELFGF